MQLLYAIVLDPTHLAVCINQLTKPSRAAGSASCGSTEKARLYIDGWVVRCREKAERRMRQKASAASLHATLTAACVRRKLPTVLKMVVGA